MEARDADRDSSTSFQVTVEMQRLECSELAVERDRRGRERACYL